jgi:hypothetical protein
MRRAYRKLFIRFLKEEKVYRPFKRNYSMQPMHDSKETLISFLKKTEKEDAIRGAFFWRNTIEGQDFWAVVSNKWRKCLEKNGCIRILFSRYWRI